MEMIQIAAAAVFSPKLSTVISRYFFISIITFFLPPKSNSL